MNAPIPRGSVLPTYIQLAEGDPLPPHRSVLTSNAGAFRDQLAGVEQDIALCEVGVAEGRQKTAFFVVTDRISRSKQLFSLLSSARNDHHYEISEIYVASQLVVSNLNRGCTASGAAKGSQNAELDEIDALIAKSIARRASDIHVTMEETGALIRFRVNGRLEIADRWENSKAETIIRALYAAGDNSSKIGSFSLSKSDKYSVTRQLNGAAVKIRVQHNDIYPDALCEEVLRVLPSGVAAKPMTFEEMGFTPYQAEQWNDMLSFPDGLIAICGTTGSGKTTTLHSVLCGKAASDPSLKITTLEDPCEFIMPGVTQRQVRDLGDGSNPWVQGIKETMRSDPDVVMIGEVRDAETLSGLIDLTLTGHLALSTIHARNAFAILERALKMGADSHILGGEGFVAGLVHQTLVQILCDSCKVEYSEANESIPQAMHKRIQAIRRPGHNIHVAGAGCHHCKNSGWSGLEVCAEIVSEMDPMVLRFIREGDIFGAKEQYRSAFDASKLSPTSMRAATTYDHAFLKMIEGRLSPVDLERTVGRLRSDSHY